MDQIFVHPNPLLRSVGLQVKITPGLLPKIRKMFKLMYAGHGIGLAAIQVGWQAQVFVMDTQIGEPLAFINPVLLEVSPDTETGEEGCLSFPGETVDKDGLRVLVRRPRFVAIEADTISCTGRSPKMKHVIHRLDGLEARVAQHEFDHLFGILMIDRTEK